MFILKLYDSNGNELKQGDIVRVEHGRRELNTFFAEVKYLEQEQAIAPFHTFSFHKFYKVDALPEGVVKSTEERYNIWYFTRKEGDTEEFDPVSQYLMDWRQCEHLLEKRCYRIEKQ
jgi:hypothetical protein